MWFKYISSAIALLIPLSLFSLVQSLRLFATPWTAAHQASLSITNSRSLLKLMYELFTGEKPDLAMMSDVL